MFYKKPGLPAIPDYLKQQIIDIAFTQRQQVVPTFGFKTLEYNNKIIKGSSYNILFNLRPQRSDSPNSST